ncbi:MAG: aquaporin family protein, partial [Planctomycetes bacterium]|nr:aquaporin family protein [Planctomycetota bacterium]
EVVGTFLLIFFGLGAGHVAVLTGDLAGLGQVGLVWGLSIMFAIYAVGGVSGAHINPAITVGLAAWGLFPWRRVAPYIFAQMGGAFLAAAVLYAVFHGFLKEKEDAKGVRRGEPGSIITAMCYGEYFPNPGPMAGGTALYDESEHRRLDARISELAACLAEILGTAILAMMVVAVTEERNPLWPQRLAPVFIGLTVTALICVIAPLTQACFNPARDFGPRLFAFFAGWGEVAIPGPRPTGFITVYILSPLIGGVLGVGFYRKTFRAVFVKETAPGAATT